MMFTGSKKFSRVTRKLKTVTGKWMHRTKAIKEHGGKDGGKEALDDMVAAGIYEEKTVMAKSKEGNTIKLEFVRVVEAETSESKNSGWKEKGRGGADVSALEFDRRAEDMLVDQDLSQPEQPEPPKGKRNALGFGG